MWVAYKPPSSGERLPIGTRVRVRGLLAFDWLYGDPQDGEIRRHLSLGPFRYVVRYRKYGLPGWVWVSPKRISHVWVARD
jgi:hypothetical protein